MSAAAIGLGVPIEVGATERLLPATYSDSEGVCELRELFRVNFALDGRRAGDGGGSVSLNADAASVDGWQNA